MYCKSISSFCLVGVLIILLITSCSEKKYAEDEKKAKNFSVKDKHSFSNPDKIRITHLHLDLGIDWDAHILKGSVTYTLQNDSNSDTLILDTRQLVISEVKSKNGAKLKYWLGKEHPIFGTPLYIQTKQQSQVVVFYQTKPECEALQWLSPEQTHDKKDPFLYSQSQAILARTWIPCQDAPAVKFTYSAHIQTKPGFMVLMSATNPQKINANGIYDLEMDQPISSYLLALSSGKIDFKPLGSLCGIYAEPGMLEKAAWEFADMQKMITEAGKLYGNYMWKRYDVLVLPSAFPFGGMENPRLTFATPTVITDDRSQVALIAHELAHSWSGNLVTNATWDDFWLNEGFTNYFEQRIMEQIYGKEYDLMRQVLAWNDLEKTMSEMKTDNVYADTRLKLDLTGRNPDDGLTDVAYDKGRFFLCHLEQVVGKANWDEFVNKYFKTNAFSYQNTEGFVDFLNKELLSKNKEWEKKANIQQWIYGEGMPKDAVKPVSKELDKVDLLVTNYLSENLKLENMDTTGFTSHHWQYFIRQIGKKLLPEPSVNGIKIVAQLNGVNILNELDAKFKFSNRGNAEICCDWFTLSAKVGYKKNRVQTQHFLCSVGRRKFLMPIYQALAQSEEGKVWARTVYKLAKGGYHSVSAISVEEVLY